MSTQLAWKIFLFSLKIAFLCTIWIFWSYCNHLCYLCYYVYVSIIHKKDMHTIIYIFSIYYYNAIYEHMDHTHSFQKRLLFIDGVVVIHAKITFYCFNDMHIYFIHYLNIKYDNNYKLFWNGAKNAIINENKNILQT